MSPAVLFKTEIVIRNNCMSVRKKFPIRLAAGLLLAIVIYTALQLWWKTAVLSLPNDGSPWLNLHAFLHNPLFIFVIFFMAWQFFNWFVVLGDAALSYPQPLPSL